MIPRWLCLEVVHFQKIHNDTVEAVQVETNDTIYLVKISSKLHKTIIAFDLDDNEKIDSETKDIDGSDFVEAEVVD